MEINKANLTDKIERVVLIGVGLSTLEERREREYVGGLLISKHLSISRISLLPISAWVGHMSTRKRSIFFSLHSEG